MSEQFAALLRDFQRGRTKPHVWLRQLEDVWFLADWVAEELSRRRPMPDQFWTPPHHRRKAK